MVLEKVTQDACFGCGACVVACSQGVLSLKINEDGFLFPELLGECTACGLCESVCPVLHPPRVETKAEVFAGFSFSKNLRVWSSSGGVFLSIGLNFVLKGKVSGVVFDNDFYQARHVLTSDPREVLQFSGSKYVQSNSTSALRAMKNSKGPFLFSGTPCQIAGIQNLIAQGILQGDFLLVDLFCHGVPSYLLWWSYLDFLRQKVGRILQIEQRVKLRDWHLFHCRVFGDRGVYLKSFLDDPFMFFYLRNYFLRNCCYQCPFRGLRSCADLRLGHFWGVFFAQDRLGTSLVAAFTDKGLRWLIEDEDIFLQSMPAEIVPASQALHLSRPVNAESAFLSLRHGTSIEDIFRKNFIWEWRKKKIRSVLFSFVERNPRLKIIRKIVKYLWRG